MAANACSVSLPMAQPHHATWLWSRQGPGRPATKATGSGLWKPPLDLRAQTPLARVPPNKRSQLAPTEKLWLADQMRAALARGRGLTQVDLVPAPAWSAQLKRDTLAGRIGRLGMVGVFCRFLRPVA